MKLDTGLDPSKAPVPVRPQFQAPMIPEEPTTPYKGVEDVASRLLNAPVDRRQFLEGARSGAAALSQLGKLGQLLPEKPVDMDPYYLQAMKAALGRHQELPQFQSWDDYFDPYATPENGDRMSALAAIVGEELKKIAPQGSKINKEQIDYMLNSLQQANESRLLHLNDSYDTDELIELLGGDDPSKFPDFMRELLTMHDAKGELASALVRGSDEDLVDIAKSLGMYDDLREMWQHGVEAYMDEVPKNEWPDWLRKREWWED
ncbi:MAG: hypothetical protein IOB84_12550 [Brevundimonas sp.]|nr:hypothetical protein [Brevundimonas sp.]